MNLTNQEGSTISGDRVPRPTGVEKRAERVELLVKLTSHRLDVLNADNDRRVQTSS
jgi:hypothetical protein